jgi:hypothetical protein
MLWPQRLNKGGRKSNPYPQSVYTRAPTREGFGVYSGVGVGVSPLGISLVCLALVWKTFRLL